MQLLPLEEVFSDVDESSSAESSSTLTAAQYFLNSVFFLSIAFIILTFVSFYRFGLMLYYKHNPRSLEISLYACVGVWGLLRALFFLITPIYPDSKVLFFIYGIATNVQVAAYSLLVLYCAQRVHFAKWRRIRWNVYWGFVALNTVLLLINVIAMLIVTLNEFTTDVPTIVNSAIFLLMFSIIAGAFVTYTILLKLQKERHALFKHENQNVLVALTAIISICVIIHCIWDLINLSLGLHIHIPSEDVKEQCTIFFLFVVWEVLPSCTVIAFFGHIPTGEEVVAQRPVEPQITVTVADGTKTGLLEAEEKRQLLPQPRPTVDGSSPGSLSGSAKRGVTLVPTAATRGTTQLVGNDGSTPNFNFVTQQLAVLAAGDGKRTNPEYEAPPRSSLEFNEVTNADEEEDNTEE